MARTINIKEFFTPTTWGLGGAIARRATITLAVMMLTAMTAWATTRTVTYTLSYKDKETRHWLDGSDNTHYNIGSGLGMAKTYTMPMGDVTITVTSAGTRCSISYYRSNTSILGFSDADYTFTFASNNYFISNVKIKDLVKRTELSVDNDTKECTVFWNYSQYKDAQQIQVTLSDTKPLLYYGITYELNGGTNAAGNPQTYEKSAGIASFADATRTGYTFGGWFDNSEFNGTAVTGIAAGSTGDKTLYAKWTPNTYSVCFNANGGTGTMSNQSFTYDIGQNLDDNNFTREDHNFSGWNTAANGSGTSYAAGASVENLALEQGTIVNLYAQWTPKNYDVTFDANGHGTAPAAQTVTYGTKATEPAAPTEEGWTFGGWYKESSCVNRWEFGADNVTGNTTLYAKWAQNVYTITYELDGGVNSANNPLVYTNTDNITLAAPTRTGYTFTGWTPDNGVISSGSTGNKTFTANWQVNQYTISFNTDGGTVISGNIAPITQNYGTTVTATATLAKQGYLFNGWAALPATMPAENITVYPDWTRLYHQGEVAATCTENGTEEYYYGNEKYWKENADGLTYTQTYYSYLVIPYTGHTWGTPQWKWGINNLDGKLEATLKLVCTHCGFIDSTPSQDGDITEEVTTAPTETTDGVRTYTAKITVYGTEYTDTHQEAIPRLFKVAKIGETEYSYLKDAMDAASSGDVITLYGDVLEPNTSCGVPNYYDKDITLDLNGHSVLIDRIVTNNSLTVKNGSLVCNIDNGAGGSTQTLTLDNANLTCVGVYNSEWGMWASGIQWMAKNIAVTNGSTMYITGGTSLGYGGEEDFNLTIDGTSCVVLENVTLSSYNMGRVKNQLEQYLPTGYSIEVNGESGKVLKNGVEYTAPVPFGPSNITLADNADNSTLISNYDGYAKNVTLSGRTLWKDGAWNTLCLPFNVTIANSPLAGADARALSSASLSGGTLTINFSDPVTELTAGTPYIIKWTSGDNLVSPVFYGVTIDKTVLDANFGTVQFKGTYAPISFTADNQSIFFMGADNTLYYPADGAYINAFRAYFQLTDGNAQVKGYVLNFGNDDDPTAIAEMVNRQSSMVNDTWFDLSGRRLADRPTRPGIYIHGGRKVVIK